MATELVVEEVASNLEEAAVVIRRFNPRSAGFLVGGLVVGAAVGFYFGHKYNKEKIRAEAFAQSEEEIQKMRTAYLGRPPVSAPKPSPTEIVEELGYSPDAVTEERPLKPPVPMSDVPLRTDDWNYRLEREKRSENFPYVIHQDEHAEMPTGYSDVTYTYWATDDVLTDEDNHPLPHADQIVGIHNLKFGHGTDDPNVVYIRNERLEIDMEIVRDPRSYEEEVMGLERNDSD